MLVGWIDLVRRPFKKRNDFVSVDARNDPKNYEMITSPPTTSLMPTKPDSAALTSLPPAREKRSPQLPQFSPSPSSQYTTDYLNKETNHPRTRNPSLSPALPQEAFYKSPKLSFSTPRPPSAGRSFSKEGSGRFPHQPQTMGRTSPRAFSPPLTGPTTTGRESAASTFSSAYDWDPTTSYAPPSAQQAPSYSDSNRPDAYHMNDRKDLFSPPKGGG